MVLKHEIEYIAAPRIDRWYVGLDVGQSIDPSAVCALHRVSEPIWNEFKPSPRDERRWIQQSRERFQVLHLERLPLGMPYPSQVQHVAGLLARQPLTSATFVLDYTGCGRPVADMFQRAGLRPHCLLITAGTDWSRDGLTWHVPKGMLVSGLEARLHSGELEIAEALTDSPALREELKDFARKVSESGRVTFNARAGAHDDLVLAVAIALFAATTGRTRSWTTELPF